MNYSLAAYENGLQLLLECVAKEHPEYITILSFQTRLKENIAQTRLANDMEELYIRRKYIIADLNNATRRVIGISFIELCVSSSPLLTYIATVQKTVSYAYEVCNTQERIWPDQCDRIIIPLCKMSVLDCIAVSMLDPVSEELYYIDECIHQLIELVEDLKEGYQKSSRQIQNKQTEILRTILLLVECLQEVDNVSFEGLISLYRNEVSSPASLSQPSTQDQEQIYHHPSDQNTNHHQVEDLPMEVQRNGSEPTNQDQIVDQKLSTEQMEESSTNEVNQSILREAMVKTFSMEDLEELCADIEQALRSKGIKLQVNLEIIGGHPGKRSKVLYLIGYLNRNGYLSYLTTQVRMAKPGIVF